MTAGYFFLLLRQIAFHFDNFHAVEQGARNGLQTVGRGDEEHLGEVEVEVQIVVVESIVLLRVEYFEQRAVRVAVVIVFRHLVNLVEHEERVGRLGFGNALDDAARHGADVGASVAAYLSLVVDASQGDAHILAAQGFGDALAERCLAHSRRAVKAEDGSLVRFAVAQGGQMFQNALLHLFHAVVVAIEDVLGIADVQVVVSVNTPRQADNGLQVVELHVVIRYLRIDAFEFLQLAAECGFDLFGKYQLGGFLLQVGHVAVFVLAQLALYVFNLLVEEELLLLLV